MNILFFSPFFPPNPAPESIVNGKLVSAFLERGDCLHVITSYGAKVDSSELWKPLVRVTSVVTIEHGFALFWKRLIAILRMKNPIKGGVWAYKAYLTALDYLENNRVDVILSRSQHTCGHLPALIISKRSGIPWVANWNDPDPLIRSPYPYGKGQKTPISFWDHRFINQVALRASWHTFPNKRLMNYMIEMYPLMKGKSSVIPHIALSKLKNSKSYNQDSFIICHSGSIAAPRNPNPFFLGMSIFLQSISKTSTVELVFVGVDENRVNEFNVPGNVKAVSRFLPQCNYEESLNLMLNSTIHLILEPPLEESIYLLTKFVDAAQCGRTILNVAPVSGCGVDLLSQYGGGLSVDCNSPDDIADALKSLYCKWQNGALEFDYSTGKLFNYFSESSVLNIYDEIFYAIKAKG